MAHCAHLNVILKISEMPIPIAIILCEGDIDDIAHVNEALQRKLPVIVMKGSGKAADLVSAYLEK